MSNSISRMPNSVRTFSAAHTVLKMTALYERSTLGAGSRVTQVLTPREILLLLGPNLRQDHFGLIQTGQERDTRNLSHIQRISQVLTVARETTEDVIAISLHGTFLAQEGDEHVMIRAQALQVFAPVDGAGEE